MNRDIQYEPDYRHWLKRMDQWRLDQAVSLLLNVEPEKCGDLREADNNFDACFRKTLKAARAAENESLTVIKITVVTDLRVDLAIVKPVIFIQWAQAKDYELNDELLQFLRSNDHEKMVTGSLSTLQNTEYWKSLENKATKAIDEYPRWSKDKRKIQKVGNLMIWIKENITKNEREADIIKKILTEVFKLN